MRSIYLVVFSHYTVMRWQYSTCKEGGKCFDIKQSTNLRFRDFMSFRQFYLFCDCTSFAIFSSRKLKLTSVLESELQNSVTYWGPYFFAFSVSFWRTTLPLFSVYAVLPGMMSILFLGWHVTQGWSVGRLQCLGHGEGWLL